MPTAVLLSGGLDSAVLLADEAGRGEARPIYVSAGLAWERGELALVGRLLAAEPFRGRVGSLVTLTVEMRDVYAATHWAVQGQPPSYHTPDEDVYLPGRNIVLFSKAAVYCAAAGIERLVIGTLAHNPFPDATPAFLAAMARALSLGLGHPLTIDAPYAAAGKADLVRRGHALGVPFDLTLSCMNPLVKAPPAPLEPLVVHCGLCSKCRERHDAFVEAGMDDPSHYADGRFVTAGQRRGPLSRPTL
jgi:7-cyano-7-deazaguanine synthase